MNKWESYVKKLIKQINKDADAVVLGVTGTKKERIDTLRVYMNGGRILQIPLRETKFEFGDSYFIKKGKHYYRYLNEDEIDKVCAIIEQINENPYAWEDNEYSLLVEYLRYMRSATHKRFNESKRNSGLKERSEQIRFYKERLTGDFKDFPWAIVDVEFQTTEIMNYSSEELQNRKAEQKEIHRSKPDFVAVTEDGFILVELKTNAEACNGTAGLQDHSNDLNKLIRINEQNHYIVEELQDRLHYVEKYQLYNSNYEKVIKGLLSKDSKDLKLYAKYLFFSNEGFRKEKIEEIVNNHNIKKEEYIVL